MPGFEPELSGLESLVLPDYTTHLLRKGRLTLRHEHDRPLDASSLLPLSELILLAQYQH